MFTKVNKDSVIICNNSFCQYKKFQKRVRFYSKTAFAGILICTIITSSVLYFMMPGKPSSFAATYTWVQTDWSGGADTMNFPVHPENQTEWGKYYEKDAGITAGTNLTLGSVPATASLTSSQYNTGDAVNALSKISWTEDLSHWQFRKPFTISNSGDAQTDYQVLLTLDTSALVAAGKMNADCSDIRTTDLGGSTNIGHWLVSGCNTATTNVWIEVPSIPNGGTTVYVYYGNANASSTSNFDNTFTKDYSESGLAGLWHMDEGSGTAMSDSSGNSNNGTLGGDGLGTDLPAWAGTDGGFSGIDGSTAFSTGDYLSFDGIDDFVSVADSATLNITDAITLSAWANITADPIYTAKSDINTDSQFTNRKLITITTTGTSTPVNYQVKVTVPYDSNMQIDFQDVRFNTTDGTYIDYWIESSTTSTTADIWIELPDAITDPGSDDIYMYYGNGVLNDSGDRSTVFISAIGGTITYIGNEIVHTFTSSGTFTSSSIFNAASLIVAGGGSAFLGGGGGGGLIYNNSDSVVVQNYSVVVGAGGVAGGNQGENSSFNSNIAIGGGYGGGFDDGGNGGSGGGSGGSNEIIRNGGTGISGQGNNGGNHSGYIDTPWPSGGGGGGGAVGQNAPNSSTAGNGGDGLSYDISGASTYYAGGGGGATRNPGSYGSGGLGGGGDGTTTGQSGTPNTGGGSGGSLGTGEKTQIGGSGIIIIRYTNRVIIANEPTPSIGTEQSPIQTAILLKENDYALGASITTVYATINNQIISSAISAGWNYLTLTYDKDASGTEEMKLYINGAEATTGDYSTAISTNANDLTIGGFLNGEIDEVRVYNRALSTEEITAQYERRKYASPVPSAGSAGSEENGSYVVDSNDIKFQLRTSADGVAWTDWCGPDDGVAGCDTTTYFTDPTGVETVDTDFTDGTGDQYVQYKVWLSSSGGSAPILSDVTLQYIINSQPTVAVTYADQDSLGIVNISYTIADAEETSATVSFLADVGVALNEELTNTDSTAITVTNIDRLPSSGTIQIENEQISYTSKTGNDLTGTITRGANNTKNLAHSSSDVIWIKGITVSGDQGTVMGISSTASSKVGTWTIKNDLDGVYYATAKIRVVANDGNGANQVGNGNSGTFVLDVKDPILGTYPILADATVSPANLTLDATDDTAFEMKISLLADLSDASWETYNAFSTIELATDPDTVYVQFRDFKGNTSTIQSINTPETPDNPMVQDTSNIGTSEWRLFVAWKVADVTDPVSFSSYEIYRSEDNVTYTFLSSIVDRAINFYTDNTTANDIIYYYKIFTTDIDGNQSYYSTVISGKADGIQGDGEGGGGGDATAPSITHDYTTQITSVTSTTATITFTTDELSDSYIGYSTDTSYGNEQGASTMIASGVTHTVTLVGLDENTTYHYKIKSRDPSGNVGSSQDDVNYVFTTITDTTPPVVTFTSSTDITSVTDSSATISWTTDEAATSLIDYGTDTSYGSNEANANYNVDHSVTLNSLLPETTYYFKITSVDNSISANSATDDNSTAGYTFTTLASSDSTPPVISAVSSGTPLYNTATITWTTDENANSLVDFGTTTSYGITQGNSADSTTSHSVVLTGLAPDTTYYYRVKSMDVSGNTAIDDNSEAGWTFLTATGSSGDTAPEISSVSSSSITSTGATITWTTDESSDSTVGFSLDTSFNTEQGATALTTSHSIDLINLAPETTYYYQVKSSDAAGNLGTDNNSGPGYTFTTLAGGDMLAPIISDVTISDLTASTAKITWTTNENSNSLVDYSGTSGVFTSTGGQYQDNTISHTVTLRGLDPSTAYYLQARSADASSNEGKDSNGGTGYTFTTTAGGDETPPEITDISAGTPTYNSVTITWTTNELSNSLVDFGTSTSYGTTQGNSSDSLTSHSVSLTGLVPSTTYYYRVKSIDVSGNLVSDDNSGAGHTFTTAAGADEGDITAPVITFDSSAGITNITSSSATISWITDESSDSIIGYSLDTSFNTEKGSAILMTDHSVILTNLSSGTAYKFQIKSMDASGNMATENNGGDGYSFETLAGGDSTAPIISGVSSGTCTDTTCAISWTTDENSSSLVDYGTVLGTYLSTGGNYKASVTSHSVTLTGLTAETIYYYRIRSIDANDNQATDAGGASGYSFATIATEESECPTCPSCGGGSCPSTDINPPTISNVTVSAITTNSVEVKWETNEKGYSIAEFGLDNSYGGITGLYNNSVKSHSVKISGLESGIVYHYRVASADSSGNLAQSEDFTFKTVTFNELSLEEQEEQTYELNETTASEIQTKIEELLTQGIDEEEIRIIIARASEPPVISTEGPIVENVTNNSAKVIWITDRKSNSVIRFKAKEEGVEPETSSSLKQYGNFKELSVEHQVILASLHSGTNYQYQVQSSDVLGNTSKSDWHEFSTEITPSIYDVIISEITLNSAVISWKTNVVSTSKVEYGETISYADSVEDKGLSKVAKHSIKLNNLKSGTLYHFRVRGMDNESGSLVSDDYSFTTFTLPQIETYQIEEIDERTVKLNWKTNVETDSVLKYTDLETNITKTQGEDGMSSIHNFTLKGLNPGIEYLLQIQGRDIYGNQAITSEFTATTLVDNTIPQITQVRTETAVSSGKSDVVQTIISWKTNEPTTSQILWEEGISEDSIPKNATLEDENYTTNHIIVITTFKPSSVYRFRIQGKDKSDNLAQSQDFTILIPEKKKSVIQIIISNFEDTFGWVKNIGM